MRAIDILQKIIDPTQLHIHKTRLSAVFAAAEALLLGQRLTLSALGRSIQSETAPKHSIKRIDHLLGNEHLFQERILFYKAMANKLLQGQKRPVISVDWSGVSVDSRHHTLRAAVGVGGRAITLYEEVHTLQNLGNRKIEEQFLETLRSIVAPNCKPVLLTDAGFRSPWFCAVEKMGFDFIGRVRGRTKAKLTRNSCWSPIKSLFTQAKCKPRLFLNALLTVRKPRLCTLVLVRKPKHRRKAKNRRGEPKLSRVSKHYAKSNSEPWVLASNMTHLCAHKIVDLYKTRMQIEESFRDLKSTSTGWEFEHHRSRSAKRIAIMLLIASIATFATWLVGLIAKNDGFHLRLQANTIKHRNVFSCFFLGRWLLRKHKLAPFPIQALSIAFLSLKSNLVLAP